MESSKVVGGGGVARNQPTKQQRDSEEMRGEEGQETHHRGIGVHGSSNPNLET